MMSMLEYFFQRPAGYAIFWATVLFVVLYFLTRQRVWLSRLIFIGIIVQMIFVSLHFTARLNNIVITKDTAFQVMNFSMILLWMAHLYNKDGFKLLQTPMTIAVFVFFVICVIGTYWAPMIFKYYAVEWASRFGAGIALFYLMVQFVNTRSRWNIALYTLLAMMAVTSIYCIMQVHGYDFMSWGRIVNVSTFGNKDFAASFWTYTAPIALFMAIGARNLFDAVIYAGMAYVGFYNMWTGETRGAWVGMMALVGPMLIFESRFGRLRQWVGNWKRQIAFWAIALVVVIGVTSVFISGHRLNTFKSIFQTSSGTNIIRVYMWWTAVRMIWDQPLLGQGLGVSHVTYPFFRPDRYHRIGMSHNTDYVHSEELQILCEQGILGFAAWSAMLLIFFWIVYQKLKTIDDITERYTIFGIAGAFFAAVVHDSMNVNLRWTSSMIAFWYVLALGTRYCAGFDEPETVKQVQKEARRRPYGGQPTDPRTYALMPFVVAAFAFMFYGQWRVIRGDWSLKATEESGGQSSIQKGFDTLHYNPYSHSAYYKIAFHLLNENKIDEALQKYFGLLTIAPNYAQTHQNTGLIFYRKYGNTNARKFLYQSILEFEWATLLENNFDNHTKLLQIYTHLINDSARGRYHNQYLFWNVRQDYFFTLFRLWDTIFRIGGMAPQEKQFNFQNSTKDFSDFGREYWLYRTDTVRKIARPKEELRYAMKMSVRYVPGNQNLVQFAVGTLMQPSDEPEKELLYLINVVENLEAEHIPRDLLAQIRAQLIQQAGGAPLPPLIAYALGVFSHKIGDSQGALAYFQLAQSSGGDRYQMIRHGVKKYKI